MTYKVTAGYVTVQTSVGKSRAHIDIPRGAHLPEDVSAEEVDWLVRTGQIVEDEAPEPESESEAESEPEPDRESEPDSDPQAENPAEAEPAEDLDSMEKADLVQIAEDEGVEIDGRWSAERVANAIRDHRS